jgi:hypothetical protein
MEKKHLPAPLGDAGVVTYIQPTSFLISLLEGLLVWSLWLAASSRGDATPVACPNSTVSWSQWRSTSFASEATQAERWLLKC